MGIFHKTDSESLGLVEYLPLYNPNQSNIIKENTLQVRIFPNPTHDYVQVEGKASKYSLQFYSLNGQMAREFHCKNREKISTTSLQPGIYMVRIQSNRGEHTTRKVVITE